MPLSREQSIIPGMTTINSLDDFLRAPDANPSRREAIRTRIPGEELLQLPAKFDAFAREQSVRGTNLEERVGRVENDIGTLKGDFARTRAIQDAPGIASDMGLEFVQTLTSTDLGRMAGDAITKNVSRSFRNADLVIEPTDGTGTRYTVMEVSFTADRRDCDRAIRNAGPIARFTGKPAKAPVASVRNAREATEAVESGAVYWHPLEDRTPSPE